MNYNPKVYEWSANYEQEPDCCSDEMQTLECKTNDGGGGPFLIIKTERWALNPEDIDAFADMLKNFMKKYEKTKTD